MLTEALVGGALGRRNAGAESLGWAEAEKPAGEKQLSVQSSRNREKIEAVGAKGRVIEDYG